MEEGGCVLSLPAFEPAWHTLSHSPEGAPQAVDTASFCFVVFEISVD